MIYRERRKTVKNNLKALGKASSDIDLALEKAGIAQTERAEKLTVDQILALERAL